MWADNNEQEKKSINNDDISAKRRMGGRDGIIYGIAGSDMNGWCWACEALLSTPISL